jgi:BirA family biotin operon repressor/biotin-[acetyl-CoA-carboxylase] ligase
VKASRQKLVSAEIESVLVALNCDWVQVDVLDQVGSTNDEVLAHRADVGLGRAWAVTAEEQLAGRGRLGRAWSSPWGAGVALSLCCSVSEVSGQLSSVPLRVGVAIVKALRDLGVTTQVKWPNDVVTTDEPMRKLGGVLVQLHDDVLVIGMGINVSLQQDELPTEFATSLYLQGHESISRESIIATVLNKVHIELHNEDWRSDYREVSRTLGQLVRITRVNQGNVTGQACDISDSGALLLETAEGPLEVSMGDVEHLRPAD